MKFSKYCVLGLVAAARLLLLFGVGFAAVAAMPTGTFWATFDGDGNLAGGGDGYPAGAGEWYEYTDDPSGDWYNQWWYNHPYDPDRRKIVMVSFTYTATDPSGWADVTINWSDDSWVGETSPPLPSDGHVERLSDSEYLPAGYGEPWLLRTTVCSRRTTSSSLFRTTRNGFPSIFGG